MSLQKNQQEHTEVEPQSSLGIKPHGEVTTGWPQTREWDSGNICLSDLPWMALKGCHTSLPPFNFRSHYVTRCVIDLSPPATAAFMIWLPFRFPCTRVTVSVRLAVTYVFLAYFCFRITGSWNRKPHDTVDRKWHRHRKIRTCPQHLYLLPADRSEKAGEGFSQEWTLATEDSGEPPCSLVMSLQYFGDSLLWLVSHLCLSLSCLDFFLH